MHLNGKVETLDFQIISDSDDMPIPYTVNREVRNKDKNYKSLTENYINTSGFLADIKADIAAGYALYMGQIRPSTKRSKNNWVGSQTILVDIDNSQVDKTQKDEDGKFLKIYDPKLSISEALQHPFIQKYCTLLYTTPSHTEDWHRFRLLFVLDSYISDRPLFETYILSVLNQIGADISDPSCKDCVRFFYGNTAAVFPLYQPNILLPVTVLDGLKPASPAPVSSSNLTPFPELYNRDPDAFEAWIKLALDAIPRRESGNYQECSDILMSLHWLAQQVQDSERANANFQAMAHEWSPPGSHTREDWNVYTKWLTYHLDRDDSKTFASFRNIAEKYKVFFTLDKKSSTNDRLNLFELAQRYEEGELSYFGCELEIYAFGGHVTGNLKHFQEIVEKRRQAQNSLENHDFINAQDLKDLNFTDFIPTPIWEYVHYLHTDLGWKQANLILFILGAVGSLISVGTRIKNPMTRFEMTPNLYIMGVAAASQSKSPVLDALVASPLDPIQIRLDEKNRMDLEDWNMSDRKGRPPKPINRIKSITSLESLPAYFESAQAHPDIAQVYVADESDALLNLVGYSQPEQFRENLKRAFEGKGVRNAKKTVSSVALYSYPLSILGMTQFSIAQSCKILNKEGSTDGLASRFFWLNNPEMTAAQVFTVIDETDNPILDNLYTIINNFRYPKYLFFESIAKQRFLDIANEFSKFEHDQDDENLKEYAGKFRGFLAKLAFNLKVLSLGWQAYHNPELAVYLSTDQTLNCIPNMLPLDQLWEVEIEHLEQARILVYYVFQEYKKLRLKMDNAETAAGLFSKILIKLKKVKADITPYSYRELKRIFGGSRNRATYQDIESACRQLAERKQIEIIQDGRKQLIRLLE